MVQFAYGLVLSNNPGGRHADGGSFSTRIFAFRRLGRGHALCRYVFGHGLNSGDAGMYPGTRTRQARVAHLANAIDLPAAAQLLHLESNLARNQRCVGELGKTGTDGVGTSPSLERRNRKRALITNLEQIRATRKANRAAGRMMGRPCAKNARVADFV